MVLLHSASPYPTKYGLDRSLPRFAQALGVALDASRTGFVKFMSDLRLLFDVLLYAGLLSQSRGS